ncbi:MAG: O-antigen ligase family protein [Thermoleophilia bacterium]
MSSVSHELAAVPGAARDRPRVASLARHAGPLALPVAVAAAIAGLALSGGGYALGVRSPVAIAVWWTAGLAIALGLWPRTRLPRPAAHALALLGALALLAAASALWTDNAEAAVDDAGRAAFYAGVLLLVVIAARRGSAERWSDGAAVGIAVIALAALASRLLPGLGLGAGASQFFAGDLYLSYPLDYWNGLAAFVAMGFPLLLRIGLDGRSAWARALAVGMLPALAGTLYLTSSRGGMLAAAIAASVFVILCAQRLRAATALAIAVAGAVAVVVALGTREALVDGPFDGSAAAAQGRSGALLIALVCVAVAGAWHLASGVGVSLPRPGRALRRAAVAFTALLVAAAVVAADPAARFASFRAAPPDPSADIAATDTDLGTGSHLLSGEGNGRWQFWEGAVEAFAEKPLLGHGAGSYEAWWAQHGSITYFTRQAHSLVLETGAELGLAGLLLLGGLAGVVALSALRRHRAATAGGRTTVAALTAVAAGYGVSSGIDWMWEIPAVTIVGLLAIGLLTGGATLAPADRGEAEAPAADGRRRRAARIVVPVSAAVAIGLVALPWLAQREVRDSRAAALAGQPAAAIDAARAAQALTPWAASPHLQHALALEAGGDLEGARHEIARAERRAPSDWRLPLVSARIERTAGNAAGARSALQRARSLNPRSALFAPTRPAQEDPTP